MSEVLPKTGFQSPFDVPTPEGAEGWEEMYPYYLLFDPERREAEEKRFWFYNGMHFPEPMPAFDMITAESCYLSIGLYQGRVFRSRPCSASSTASSTATSTSPPTRSATRPRSRSGSRSSCRGSASTTQLGMLVDRWQAAVDKRDRGAHRARGAEAARARGRAGGDPRPQARLELPADDAHTTTHAALQRAQPAPLRAAAAGLRRVPDLLPVLPGAFPDMGMQIDDADDRRLRHDDVPARRRAEGAGARGARQAAWTAAFADGRSPRRCWPSSSERRRAANGSPTSSRASTRGSSCRPATASTTTIARGPTTSSLPFAAIAGYIAQIRRGHEASTGPRSGCSPSATGSPPSTRSCSATDEEREQFDGDARPLPPRLPPRGGAQVLHRALGHLAVLQQDARDRRRSWPTTASSRSADDVFYLNIHEVHEALFDLGLAWSGGTPGRGTVYWPPRVARRKEILAQARRVDAAAGARHRCRR